ncbi:hypothetical protein IL54_3748 [Sphingobium sp. ba1]|nr:hypothetical protein IL54_3748 [Sphingobium sp. ba1]
MGIGSNAGPHFCFESDRADNGAG